MKSKILIVEDEPAMVAGLRDNFEYEGYDVISAEDGVSGLDKALSDNPDLVVLDVMMPGTDGIDVLRRLRTGSDVYVILLTARSEEVDKLIGLSVGADDYVTKPFSPRELVARIKAVLRRGRGPESVESAERLEFGTLVINVDGREVERDGKPVELSTLEFELLMALASAPGRALTRRQLLERVWGWDFYGDERVVDVHIRSIRKALGDSADEPELIGTVRGVGYKFLGGPT
jgi:DNA-binding response OmpR family regulator